MQKLYYDFTAYYKSKYPEARVETVVVSFRIEFWNQYSKKTNGTIQTQKTKYQNLTFTIPSHFFFSSTTDNYWIDSATRRMTRDQPMKAGPDMYKPSR